MEKEKSVDESWKESAAKAKESEVSSEKQASSDAESGIPEVNFLNYITSLGFQAIIFLGEIPSPITNKTEKNLKQAKFIIDTLAMLKDKTKGNLAKQEEDILNATVYELQLKYVEALKKDQESDKA